MEYVLWQDGRRLSRERAAIFSILLQENHGQEARQAGGELQAARAGTGRARNC